MFEIKDTEKVPIAIHLGKLIYSILITYFFGASSISCIAFSRIGSMLKGVVTPQNWTVLAGILNNSSIIAPETRSILLNSAINRQIR